MEIKFKRVMSISTARLLNLTRDVMDNELTPDEFYKMMFILGSYEEAGWTEENLKQKAKILINDLSPYAKEQLDKAIAEGSQMYQRCWDLIEKQNRARNKGKGKETGTTGTTGTTTNTSVTTDTDNEPIYNTLGTKIILMPKGREQLKQYKITAEEMQEFLNHQFEFYRNDGPIDNMFSIEELVEDYKEYQKELRKQYPAAPSRGK